MSTHFATLTFDRTVGCDPATLWHAWTAPAARALWSPPGPGVSVEFQSADPREGGEEHSLCKVAGEPDIACAIRWLAMEPGLRSVNSEVIRREGAILSAALVTADMAAAEGGSDLRLTVQLAAIDPEQEAGYRAGFGAALGHLAGVAERTMLLDRHIAAPPAAIWSAWADPAALPLWWGPDGFSCRTQRIDLRQGGEWVFDMIGPDGTVFPNHHRYTVHQPQSRIEYTLHRGEDGPKHADASVAFTPEGGGTRVSLAMIFADQGEYAQAKGFGAVELGMQTLGKLARQVGAG